MIASGQMHKRIVFLDYMRVIACFMVIMVHSCEFFFIDGDRIGIRSLNDGFWVSVIDSAFRCSVPLFVMISAWLLVPVRGSVSQFFRKRLVRVVIPFVFWSLLYAVLPLSWGGKTGTDALDSLLRLSYNFNGESGHMWFVYMLVGLYLFMPVISPWLEHTGKRGKQMFLLLWFIASFFPYIRDRVGDVYGECYWNEFNLLWYFSGFLGYVVLADYIRQHLEWTCGKSVAVGILLYAAGYVITAMVWYGRIETAVTLQQLELSWRFCTPNVIAMSLGAFLIIKALYGQSRESRAVEEVSHLSYGIYLMHIFILTGVFQQISGCMSVPATILSVGVITFMLCIILTKLISFLPGSKYIIG